MVTTQPLNAAYYYQVGVDLYEKKRFLDAQMMFERACRLEPENAEFAAARERLPILAASLGNWFSKKPTDPSASAGSSFWDCCGEGCCECCGECCSQGCAEGCGECCSNCDGCDCDCG